MIVIGWDVGGAHLKGARMEEGRILGAVSIACPLWQGLDRLDTAFVEAERQLGQAPRHAVTMTGELTDLFADRLDGIATLTERIAATLTGEIAFYAGKVGWVSARDAAHEGAIASANWHATAALAARAQHNAVFADMGSTTTDLIAIADGRIAARGGTDAERLISGELVYTGATRTFLMAVAPRVPFRGAWTPLMNEYFASMADVYRITGELPQSIDKHPAADNREKSVAASIARVARMIGRDAADADAHEWRALAAYFAEAQLRQIHDAALQVMSAASLPGEAPLIIAGSGRFVLEKLAARLGRRTIPWESLVSGPVELAPLISECAPAVAVGLLLSDRHASPP